MALIWVGNIEEETKANTTFRTALWTGKHSQLTVMSLKPGEDIGLEVHPEVDQFLRLEQGKGRLEVGPARDELSESYDVGEDWAFVVPAGTWHNVINTGDTELKLYTIYSPPNHPDGTVHTTKAEAEAAEHGDEAWPDRPSGRR
jgi:mannose-6-phosphate isomerase-like protein (cupin superfamily)